MSNTLKTLSKGKIWIVCALACIAMAFLSPAFLTGNNLTSIMVSMYPYGMVALGLMFGLITGVNNLTIGSIVALSAVVFAMVTEAYGVAAGFCAGMIAGALVGVLNGFMVAYLNMDGWLVTIALMISVRGVASALTGGRSIRIANEFFQYISAAKFGAVPILFVVFLLFVLAMQFVLRQTGFGRNMYAVGGNAEAASSCGLNVRRVRLIAMIVSSTLAGIGGMLLTTRLFSANGELGTDAIMSCLPMVIIGGATFTGGKGDALGALSGTLMMVLITNFINLFNVYVNVQKIIQGLILVIIIISDKYFVNRHIKV